MQLFSENGCELLGKYDGSGVPVEYRCKCGVRGLISLDKFRRRLRRGEGCENCNVFVWNGFYDQILRDFYGKESRKRILEMIPGVSYGSLKARVKKLGLIGNKSVSMSKAHGLIKHKYDINADFFAKKSSIVCYWAGVLACSSVNVGKNSLILFLPLERRVLLEKFQDVICHTGVIDDSMSGRCGLRLYGVGKWISDIRKNFGDIWKSDLCLRRERDVLSFVVGYMDARGCIKNFLRDYRIEISGRKKLLDWVKNLFDRWVPPLGGDFCSIQIGKRNSYIYSVWNVRAKFLIKKLWSVEVPRFDLVWEKFASLK